MKNKSCLVILVGESTYRLKWYKYVIEHAWKQGKGISL